MGLRSGTIVLCLIWLAGDGGLLTCQTLGRVALSAWPAAQVQGPAAPGQTASAVQLNIKVVQGADAVNTIGTHVARELAVEVDDQNQHPISGAQVTFFAPSDGAGGTFSGDRQLLTVATGVNGRAVVPSFRPNGNTGDFRIEVTASFANQKATAYISQSNQRTVAEPVANKHKARTIAIVAGGAAAALIAGLELSHGGSNSATPTASLGLGSGPTVGALH